MTSPFRIGLGYDSHRLGPGGPLRIGGVDIECDLHSIGHSDADVLLHAITDALLGSVAAADIGRLFPDNAEVNRGRDSRDFLAEAMSRVEQAGYQIANLDAVILAQKPKFAPSIDLIRTRIADLLECSVSDIGLKAKTGEGVGPIGNSEAIAARAVVMVWKNS